VTRATDAQLRRSTPSPPREAGNPSSGARVPGEVSCWRADRRRKDSLLILTHLGATIGGIVIGWAIRDRRQT
jgi:hypothetical protein